MGLSKSPAIPSSERDTPRRCSGSRREGPGLRQAPSPLHGHPSHLSQFVTGLSSKGGSSGSAVAVFLEQIIHPEKDSSNPVLLLPFWGHFPSFISLFLNKKS